jgi:hypothetical protein
MSPEAQLTSTFLRLYGEDGFLDAKVSRSHSDLHVTFAQSQLHAPYEAYSSCSLHIRSTTLTSSCPIAPTTLLE